MKNKQMTLEELDQLVADLLFYGAKIEYLGQSRQVVDRKRMICYLAVKTANFTIRELAEYFGNTEKNIRYLVKSAESMAEIDKIFFYQIEKVSNFINFAK